MTPSSLARIVDPARDRKNGDIFIWANLLTFLSAPVRYVGVAQAALCDKLGSSATVANLPAAAFFFASFAPIVVACFVPYRFERRMVVLMSSGAALILGLVAMALFLPLSNLLRVDLVVGQGLLLGALTAVQRVYFFQCLGRGTTERGRARALKLTFALGPVAAVAGSLATQFILRGGVPWLVFPKDFAVLYLVGALCAAVMAWWCGKMDLATLAEEEKPQFFPYLRESFRPFLRSRNMTLLWLGYLFWHFALLAVPNLSLFARHAMGREPAAYSGLIMAIEFGSKAVAGYGLGVLYIRHGVRAPLIATMAALGLGLLWAWTVSGNSYLAAFAFTGAGELGAIYFPIVLLSWSPSSSAARHMAVLSLAAAAASPGPAVYGFVTDHWGFSSSSVLGIATAVIGLYLVLRLPLGRGASELSDSPKGQEAGA